MLNIKLLLLLAEEQFYLRKLLTEQTLALVGSSSHSLESTITLGKSLTYFATFDKCHNSKFFLLANLSSLLNLFYLFLYKSLAS